MFKEISSSASKIVFIMMALTVCVAFFMTKVSEQAFLSLATMAFSTYYVTRGKEEVNKTTNIQAD